MLQTLPIAALSLGNLGSADLKGSCPKEQLSLFGQKMGCLVSTCAQKTESSCSPNAGSQRQRLPEVFRLVSPADFQDSKL